MEDGHQNTESLKLSILAMSYGSFAVPVKNVSVDYQGI